MTKSLDRIINERVISQTSESNKPAAKHFLKSVTLNKLDRRTVDKVFLMAAGPNQKTYDFETLKNLDFAGIVLDPSVSEGTGQKIFHGFKLVNKQDPSKIISLGWKTGMKFAQTAFNSDSSLLPNYFNRISRPQSFYTKILSDSDETYLAELDDFISGSKSVSDIKSIKEKQLVTGVLGLRDLIGNLETLTGEALLAHFKNGSKELIDIYQRLFTEGGSPLTQLKKNPAYLTPELADQLNLLTKNSHLLSTEQIVDFNKNLRRHYDFVAPKVLVGESRRYFTDLKTILESGSSFPKSKHLLDFILSFQSGDNSLSSLGFAGLFYMFDIRGERLKLVKEYLSSHHEFDFDFKKANSLLESIFVKDNSFVGGLASSVPKVIADSLEGLVRPGDKNLRDVQAFQRNRFASTSDDAVYKNQSIEQNSKALNSSVIIQRKKAFQGNEEKSRFFHGLRLDAKDFMPIEVYNESKDNLPISDLINRIEFLYPDVSNSFSEYQYPVSFKLYRTLKASDESKIIREETLDELFSLPAYKNLKSLKPQNTFKPLLDIYNSLIMFRRGVRAHKIIADRSSDSQINSWRSVYDESDDPNFNYYASEPYMRELIFNDLNSKIGNLIPLTLDLKFKASSLPNSLINHNAKLTFKKFALVHDQFGGDYIEKSLADRIESEYNNLG